MMGFLSTEIMSLNMVQRSNSCKKSIYTIVFKIERGTSLTFGLIYSVLLNVLVKRIMCSVLVKKICNVTKVEDYARSFAKEK